MAASYPLSVFWKGGQSMQPIEDPSHVRTLEAVDIRHGECILWDENGNGVSVAA